jgi:hypothetical protein
MAAISRERFQALIEDETWDAADMPLFASTLTTSCLEPGCKFDGVPTHALIGAALPSPDAPWPSQARGGDWPDHDGDGAPGVATRMLGPDDGPYSFPPLDLLTIRRQREVALGLRVLLGFDGKLDSCDKASGQTSHGSIETRAVACTASGPPYDCTSDELEFLNNNLPVWTAHGGRFESRRVAPTADCAAARRAFVRTHVP